MKTLTVLGIDPGLAIVGYGAVRYRNPDFAVLEAGAIRTPAHTPLPSRLNQIYQDLQAILERVRPEAAAVEELFFTNNITTGIPVAQARGVILLCLEQHGVPIFEYTPMQVKQAVVGYGRAEKKQVIELTRLMLHLKEAPKPDDTADALALAVCHAHSSDSPLQRLQRGR